MQGDMPSDWIVVEGDKEVLRLECPTELQGVKEEDIVVWVDPLDGTTEYTQGLYFYNFACIYASSNFYLVNTST